MVNFKTKIQLHLASVNSVFLIQITIQKQTYKVALKQISSPKIDSSKYDISLWIKCREIYE